MFFFQNSLKWQSYTCRWRYITTSTFKLSWRCQSLHVLIFSLILNFWDSPGFVKIMKFEIFKKMNAFFYYAIQMQFFHQVFLLHIKSLWILFTVRQKLISTFILNEIYIFYERLVHYRTRRPYLTLSRDILTHIIWPIFSTHDSCDTSRFLNSTLFQSSLLVRYTELNNLINDSLIIFCFLFGDSPPYASSVFCGIVFKTIPGPIKTGQVKTGPMKLLNEN